MYECDHYACAYVLYRCRHRSCAASRLHLRNPNLNSNTTCTMTYWNENWHTSWTRPPLFNIGSYVPFSIRIWNRQTCRQTNEQNPYCGNTARYDGRTRMCDSVMQLSTAWRCIALHCRRSAAAAVTVSAAVAQCREWYAEILEPWGRDRWHP